MTQGDKQPRRPSKSGVASDHVQKPSDVAPRAARGGDKENNEPLPRRLKGSSQPRTIPGRKPTR